MSLPARRSRLGARRWDPFSRLAGVDDLFDQMNRMFTSAFPEVPRISVRSWSPPVDVEEAEEEFRVEADVPGVAPEDVTVDLQRNELRISGQYGGEQEEEGQRSRRAAQFDYRVTLPSEVDAEGCTAKLENGVLRLRLPKAAATGRQRIQVQGGPSSGASTPIGSGKTVGQEEGQEGTS
jgi:HSP20 family protein